MRNSGSKQGEERILRGFVEGKEERMKEEKWVALANFWQLDESFIRLLSVLPEEKRGSNGRTWLEIEGF
ncbi:unnamed protein product [Prunus armeniaca]